MMTYATLLSSAQIGNDAWNSFLRSVGAERVDTPHSPYEGVLENAHGRIWVGMDNGVLEDIDTDDQQLLHLLGGPPRTAIVLETSHLPGSAELALTFACRFAEQWPCVVEVERRRYSAQDIFDLRQSDHPFLTPEG